MWPVPIFCRVVSVHTLHGIHPYKCCSLIQKIGASTYSCNHPTGNFNDNDLDRWIPSQRIYGHRTLKRTNHLQQDNWMLHFFRWTFTSHNDLEEKLFLHITYSCKYRLRYLPFGRYHRYSLQQVFRSSYLLRPRVCLLQALCWYGRLDICFNHNVHWEMKHINK